MRYRILDADKLRKRDRWSMKNWQEFTQKFPLRVRQDAVIREDIKLPKVKNKDTVFVFAGSTGEISSRIKGPKIIHSDADIARVRIAKDRYGKNYDDVVVADAFSLPTKKVDWLFSFESSPLLNRTYFVPRAIMSAKKGFIISRRADYVPFKSLRKTAQMYGIKPREFFRELRGADYGTSWKTRKKKFGFLMFENNPRAKRLAAIDNEVVERLTNVARGRKVGTTDVEKVRKSLGINEKEMRESFERINELASLRVPGVEIKRKPPKHLVVPNFEVEY